MLTRGKDRSLRRRGGHQQLSLMQRALNAVRRCGGNVWMPHAAQFGFGNPNLLSAPEDYSAAAWGNANTTPEVQTGVLAPDGSRVTKLTTSSGGNYVYRGAHPVTGGLTYSLSFYAQAGSVNGWSYIVDSTGVVLVDAAWSTVTSAGLTMVTYTFTPAAASTFVNLYVTRNIGIGYLFVGGAKLELGGPTAYTPQAVLATLGGYVDSAGTQPVSIVGDLLGLVLDKSKGMVLGPELKGTGVTGIVGSATAATYGTSTGVGSVTRVNGGNQSFVTIPGLSTSKTYKVSCSVTGPSIVSLRSESFSGSTLRSLLQGSPISLIVSNVSTLVFTLGEASGSSTFTVLSVREIPGNHATQSTTANKPSVAKNSVNKPVMVFDGSNDSLQTAITTGNEGWMCAGVTMSTLGDDYRALFYAGAVDVLQKSVYLIKGNNSFSGGKIALAISNGTTRYVLTSTVPLTPGSPFVADAGWSTSTRFVSVDGHETSEASTGNFGPSAGVLQIGSYFNTNTLNGQATAFIYCPVLPSAADRAVIRRWVGSLQGQVL